MHQTKRILVRTLLPCGVLLAALATAQAQYVLSNMWSISTTGGYTYINTDNTQRGVAFNPTTNHVYVVSRTGSPGVHILDAFTGADLGALDVTGVSGGGGGAINLVDVGDDGSIYICNLATAQGTFKLYRYTNEMSPPVVVFEGDPTGGYNGDTTTGDTNAPVTNSKRFGDNMTVRGSGTNVQVLVNARAGRASALLFPYDESMQFFMAQTILTDVNNGDIGVGVAFGPGNTYWGKAPSRNLRRLAIANPQDIYNPAAALVATTAVSVALSPTSTSGLGSLAESNLLAVIDYSGHAVRLYDTASGTGVSLQDIEPFPAPTAANANGTGVADFGTVNGNAYLFAVDSNNGVVACAVQAVNTPVITGGPFDTSILEGGYGALSVLANGVPPLVYSWYQNTNTLVLVATNNNSLVLTNVSAADAGYYRVAVSNANAGVISTNALLTVVPTVRGVTAAPIWKLPGASRPYLSTSDQTRGMAVNPFNGHVLVVSRVSGYHIYVLDGETGADLWEMNTDPTVITGSSPAGFDLNMVGVAEDGAVYACNLNTGGAFTKVYRWANDSASATPVVISEADGNLSSNGRFGDSIVVRGSGTSTQILMPSQDRSVAVLLGTSDGSFYYSTALGEDTVDGTRLGIAFGAGDTYWSKAATNLIHYGFDLFAATATALQVFNTNAFPTLGYPIGVDAPNDLLARVATINQTPDNLRLYDIVGAPQTNAPVLIDQEFFGSDNANINGVGSVAFDVARGRLFALNSNNGLLALKYAPPLRQTIEGGQLVLRWAGPAKLTRSAIYTGPYVEVAGATSPYTNTTTAPVFYRLQH